MFAQWSLWRGFFGQGGIYGGPGRDGIWTGLRREWTYIKKGAS